MAMNNGALMGHGAGSRSRSNPWPEDQSARQRHQVRSGPNAYIRNFFNTCWRMKGLCKGKCSSGEIYHILCDTSLLCCVHKKYMPLQLGE
uniref:Beta-defensin n=1 Tax=Camelus bactrianus TaxID=9837 RepID=A0A9W3FQI7_CAMBA|nr:beta-defensin 135 [Camelus bactrianus]